MVKETSMVAFYVQKPLLKLIKHYINNNVN